jgi:hypothetical protein
MELLPHQACGRFGPRNVNDTLVLQPYLTYLAFILPGKCNHQKYHCIKIEKPPPMAALSGGHASGPMPRLAFSLASGAAWHRCAQVRDT